MRNNNNSLIFWTQLSHEDWNINNAATSNGLCYVGSQSMTMEPFQLDVWKAPCEIPYGQTKSYSDIANLLGGGLHYA